MALRLRLPASYQLLTTTTRQLGIEWGTGSSLARLFFSSSEEKRKRRKEIISEFKKGHMSELNELRRSAGKRFEAISNVCLKKDALSFPVLSGVSLSKKKIQLPQQLKGNVSLVLVSMKSLGMTMCDLYRHPFSELFSKNSTVQVIEVSVVEDLLFKLLHRLLESNLRRQIELSRQDKFVSYSDKFSVHKNELDVHNSLIGYAFLVDKDGYVRWRAHGTPTDREIRAMKKCCTQLVQEN